MRTELVLLVVVAVGLSLGHPVEDTERLDTPPSNFVGEGTNELATALLQGFVEEEQNLVFLPLGYSVILAIMAEGARGETRKQLIHALHLPEDTYAVRQNYQDILNSMKDHWSTSKPEFRNWFYVYKNYTVNDSYKQILLENYLTEVTHTARTNYPGVVLLDFKNKEDKKKANTDKVKDGRADDGTKMEGEKVTGKKGEVDEKEKPDRSEFQNSKDVASAWTAIHIKESDREDIDFDPNIKMLVFNGFSFRGKWEIPFTLVKENDKRSFYRSASEKKQVSMMQVIGDFALGIVPELDATALELPYEGDQYSMLVLLPNQRDGLSKLTSDLTMFSLNCVYQHLVNKSVEVLLPKYRIQTGSQFPSQKVFEKIGVTDIFSNEADLSGISSDGQKMDDLDQMVFVQVDEGTANTNPHTTTNVGVTGDIVERFVADHPFLFFIRDRTKNIIAAAGKVLDPRF